MRDRRSAEDFHGISFEDYKQQRLRRYGTANPDPMEVPLWQAILKHGPPVEFSQRAFRTDASEPGGVPTWTFFRYGMSRTQLPDGRLIYIGGECEDWYDPSFCIFNDVIVADGFGDYEIYGYPRYHFPPTDFHSATFVKDFTLGVNGDRIIIIGGLGYQEDRIPGVTNVFALEVNRSHSANYAIHPVETKGDDPGWIWDHQAILLPDFPSIIVFGGKALNANEATVPMDDVYRLNLQTLTWERVGHLISGKLLASHYQPINEPVFDPKAYQEAADGLELPHSKPSLEGEY